MKKIGKITCILCSLFSILFALTTSRYASAEDNAAIRIDLRASQTIDDITLIPLLQKQAQVMENNMLAVLQTEGCTLSGKFERKPMGEIIKTHKGNGARAYRITATAKCLELMAFTGSVIKTDYDAHVFSGPSDDSKYVFTATNVRTGKRYLHHYRASKLENITN